MKVFIPLFAAFSAVSAFASPPEVSTALAQPIFGQPYACIEHWQGNLKGLGDELGTDCVIQQLVGVNGRVWMRAYKRDGRANADWYGWGKDVLSPCTCEVVKVSENLVVNKPGLLGKPPASFVVLKRDDGVHFLLAHVAKLHVGLGDKVEAGQVIAQVGNNGYSRHPHIHVGAWKGDEPLQIRFDQVATGKLFQQ